MMIATIARAIHVVASAISITITITIMMVASSKRRSQTLANRASRVHEQRKRKGKASQTRVGSRAGLRLAGCELRSASCVLHLAALDDQLAANATPTMVVGSQGDVAKATAWLPQPPPLLWPLLWLCALGSQPT